MVIRRPLRAAQPARLFFGVITGLPHLFDLVRDRIAGRFGPLESGEESPLFVFPGTRTYAPTMGPGPLQRKFFFLARPWPQDGLAEVKLAAVEIEEEIQESGSFEVPRPVNIDPGLLNDCRIILASTKDHAHRIYRGQGIWEEIALVFRAGAYQPLPWTYPDFRQPGYAAYFAPIRERHLKTLIPANGPPPSTAPPGSPPP
jgi:hypothetical protein